MAAPPPPQAAAATPKPPVPLVTAIMPTRDRPEWALQAVRYFCAQDYPNKELVVVEDGTASLAGRLPDDSRIRYIATGVAARSIGAMRNEACRLARGEIVAHWDDDDWYGPERLTRQVTTIKTGEADITALRGSLMLDLSTWRFWRCRPDLHRRLFVRDVHGGTLVYRRRVWEEKARFPDCSLAEDAAFLEQAVRRGARLRAVDAEGIFVYVRHGTNAWGIVCGLTGGAAGWEHAAEPDLAPEPRAFYAARSAAASEPGPSTPLVSCVMPTFDRRAFVPQSISYFLRQDYPATELIIVDDSPEPVSDLLPTDPRIVYHRLEARTVLGAKRNLACDLARGSIIVHWDDDDWASPDRVSVQVAALTSGDADVCGTGSLLCYEPATSSAWRFTWPDGLRPWAAGTSLCFRKELWTRCPFPDVAIGEDTRFVFSPAVRRVADVRAAGCVVGIIHGRNTVPKSVRGAHWSPARQRGGSSPRRGHGVLPPPRRAGIGTASHRCWPGWRAGFQVQGMDHGEPGLYRGHVEVLVRLDARDVLRLGYRDLCRRRRRCRDRHRGGERPAVRSVFIAVESAGGPGQDAPAMSARAFAVVAGLRACHDRPDRRTGRLLPVQLHLGR